MSLGEDNFELAAAKAVHELAVRMEQIRPVRLATVDLPAVASDWKSALVAKLQGLQSLAETAIYAISLPDASPPQAHRAFMAARDDHVDGRSYSRVLPLPATPTQTLYVGSSRSLQKRLLEHLGFGAKKTYSLHMQYWAQELGRIRIDIRFYGRDTDHALLCALEDHWANVLLPLFGKRGSV